MSYNYSRYRNNCISVSVMHKHHSVTFYKFIWPLKLLFDSWNFMANYFLNFFINCRQRDMRCNYTQLYNNADRLLFLWLLRFHDILQILFMEFLFKQICKLSTALQHYYSSSL